MRTFASILLLTIALVLISCARKDSGPSPHATVYLRDGSSFTGTVTSSSPSEVTIEGDDSAARTFAMKDVKSIEYDEATAPQQPAEQAKSGGKRHARERHDDHYHPEPSAITTKTYDLPAGTEISVRSEETIDSARAAEGQTYAAELTADVRDAAGDVVLPRGANAQIIIRAASKGGRIRGSSDLVLDLASVSVGGAQYQLSTVDLSQKGKPGMGANKRTAEYTGGGAAIGAIIGAIAGHGKGAAIGAGSGAGAGALTQILTKGSSIQIPAETVLTFKLDQPLHVTAAH